MKRILFILLFFSIFYDIIGQQYSVESYQGAYERIKNYKSLMIETRGVLRWEKKFNLDFDFPYFEYKFDYLICDAEGSCFFEDDINFSLRLMTFGYTPDNVLDTIDLDSDIRYKLTKINGKKCLVIEFINNRLASDNSIEEYDSYINFQYWFFEDGTIELHIGPSNLEHSPVYIPGKGFFLLTDKGPIPSGPELALYHPYDNDIELVYNDLDSYENFEIVNKGNESVDWWPPSGWVIKFSNQLVKSKTVPRSKKINLYPNPVLDYLNVANVESVERIEIYNIQGRQLYLAAKPIQKSLNLSEYEAGIYFVHFITKESNINKKIVKN